jgi:RNA polymerase sigma factor (sigma-70 family)
MTAVPLSRVVRQLRVAPAAREAAGLPDADLWDRYVRERDEAAFAALVGRHGPMVLGVCRRILRNRHDAEDAFQATFLVLVRKAASLRSPRTIANWLHGVARRTALAARGSAPERQAREAAVPPRVVTPDDPWDDLRPVLDQEITRLAEKYRIAVVLCDLEGKTRKEAARQLGWAEGTVASRLARGRGILAERLARRGFGAAVLAAALAGEAAPAGVSPALVVSTVTAVNAPAAVAAAKGAVAGNAAALAEGVLKSMQLTKLKTAVAVLLVVIATVGGGSLVAHSRATEPADGQPKRPADRDDPPDRLERLKQKLQQIQKQLDRLEQQAPPRRDGRNQNDALLADLFKHRVPFEIGYTETSEGRRIEIREVWGTRPRIEVGGQYLVRGRYVLPPGERGKLYFYATAGGDWGQAQLATLDLQTVTLDRESGEFTLVHGMSGPGYFHLYLASPDRYSRYFANVYFGTGDNVLRTKP